MSARTRFALAIVVLGLLMTGPFILTALIVWLETHDEGRQQLTEVLLPHLGVGTMLTIVGFAAGVGVLRILFRQYVQGLLRMAENLRLMLGANRGFRVQPEGPPEVQMLASAANELATQRDEIFSDVEAQIARAKDSVEQEKNRLAALMSELTQSVVVCNLDGRILLYNNRARMQFRALSDAPGVAGGGELIGLGRSIYAVFERNLIAHALETSSSASGAVRLSRRPTSSPPRARASCFACRWRRCWRWRSRRGMAEQRRRPSARRPVSS